VPMNQTKTIMFIVKICVSNALVGLNACLSRHVALLSYFMLLNI
jgi:hypothetical protein